MEYFMDNMIFEFGSKESEEQGLEKNNWEKKRKNPKEYKYLN